MTGEPLADAIVRDVAAAVRLAEGEAGVRDVIRAVDRARVAPTRRLSRATGLPVPVVAAVAGELRKRGVVAPERPTRLTPRGRRLFGEPGADAALDCTCAACDGRGLSIPAALEPVVAELARIAAGAPPARSELDQSHCTVETKLRKALALHHAGALAGKRILILGDDDLVAAAIYLLAARGGIADAIRELAVVDVDRGVLAQVGNTLAAATFPVTRIEHDLRDPLPHALSERYDAVVTDPPYTVAGAQLFLSRAAAALAPGPGGAVFLSFGPKPPDDALRVQAAIAEMGFVIRRIVPNFNDYVAAGLIGGTSHLYHLTSTNETRPLVPGRYDGPLYTGDTRAARRYRCASCRSIHAVGRGSRWTTVDALTSDGCPECGAAKFRPLPRTDRGAQ